MRPCSPYISVCFGHCYRKPRIRGPQKLKRTVAHIEFSVFSTLSTIAGNLAVAKYLRPLLQILWLSFSSWEQIAVEDSENPHLCDTLVGLTLAFPVRGQSTWSERSCSHVSNAFGLVINLSEQRHLVWDWSMQAAIQGQDVLVAIQYGKEWSVCLEGFGPTAFAMLLC